MKANVCLLRQIEELRHTSDLGLCATKQTAAAKGCATAAVVAMERHLWLNLADIEKKEKSFPLNAPVSRLELFNTSVEMVVSKFREAKVQCVAFKRFILWQ